MDLDIFAKLQGAREQQIELLPKRQQGPIRSKAREILWCCQHGVVDAIDKLEMQLLCREFDETPRKDWGAKIEAFYVLNHVGRLYWNADRSEIERQEEVDKLERIDQEIDRDYEPHRIETAINPGERKEWVLHNRNVYWKWQRTWYWLGYLIIQNDTRSVWASGLGRDAWDIKRVDLDLVSSNPRVSWIPTVKVTRDGSKDGLAQYCITLFINERPGFQAQPATRR